MQPAITILDAHVHIHDCFDISDFLDHAYQNFRNEVDARKPLAKFNAVLLLTESYGANWFEKLQESVQTVDQVPWKNWHIAANQESVSLTASSKKGQELIIVAGRQIVTAENLEILALGYAAGIEDGLPIEKVIDIVQAAGALCVLPWGFGKWTGKRGRIVRAILQRDLGRNFFIGDNAGRLAIWPRPVEFRSAANRNVRILPGSDPLPYKAQVSSAGRFGLMIEREIDTEYPCQDLCRALIEEDTAITPYGTLEGLLPFIKYQVAMQLRKFSI